MITKEQFEALVRADAQREFPLVNHEGPIDFSINDRQRDHRGTYIAARMEHEWLLVEALKLAIGHLVETDKCTLEYTPPASAMRRAADAFEKREADIRTIQSALSIYTTKPTEQ